MRVGRVFWDGFAVNDKEKGSILGVTQSAGTLGRIFGLLFATTAYKYYPHSPCVGAATLCVIAGLLAARKLRSVRPIHAPATQG